MYIAFIKGKDEKPEPKKKQSQRTQEEIRKGAIDYIIKHNRKLREAEARKR